MPTFWLISTPTTCFGNDCRLLDCDGDVLEFFGRVNFLQASPTVRDWVIRLCGLTNTPFLDLAPASDHLKHLTTEERSWLSILPGASLPEFAIEASDGLALAKRVGEIIQTFPKIWMRLESILGVSVISWPSQARHSQKVKWLLGEDSHSAAEEIGLKCSQDCVLSLTEGTIVHNRLLEDGLTKAVRVALRNYHNACRWPGSWEPWAATFPNAVRGWPVSFLYRYCSIAERKLLDAMRKKWQLSLIGHLCVFEPELITRIGKIQNGAQIIGQAKALSR